MVSLITPSTVCKRFKIQLLALFLVLFVYHTSLRFLNLCIGYRINFEVCCITQSELSLHEPHYLSSLFRLRSNFHSLCSSSFSPSLLPYFNKKSFGFRSYSYATLHLWNHLPNNVRTAPTFTSFRKSENLSF